MDDGVATTAGRERKLVVLYPSPGMGHLVSMIELGKLFAARGLAVTILIVELPFVDTGARGPFLAGVTAANPAISFHCLPRVQFPPLASPHPEAVTYEVARLSNPHLRDFLLTGTPPAVLVVDFFCSVALDLAAELGVPGYCFFTSGAEALASFLYLPVLHEQSAASFREMGEELVRVPGIAPFPATHALKPLQDRDDAAYRGFLQVSPDLCRSRGIIVNTFRSKVAGNRERWAVPRSGFIDPESDSGTRVDSVRFDADSSFPQPDRRFRFSDLTVLVLESIE